MGGVIMHTMNGSNPGTEKIKEIVKNRVIKIAYRVFIFILS